MRPASPGAPIRRSRSAFPSVCWQIPPYLLGDSFHHRHLDRRQLVVLPGEIMELVHMVHLSSEIGTMILIDEVVPKFKNMIHGVLMDNAFIGFTK